MITSKKIVVKDSGRRYQLLVLLHLLGIKHPSEETRAKIAIWAKRVQDKTVDMRTFERVNTNFLKERL